MFINASRPRPPSHAADPRFLRYLSTTPSSWQCQRISIFINAVEHKPLIHEPLADTLNGYQSSRLRTPRSLGSQNSQFLSMSSITGRLIRGRLAESLSVYQSS